MDISKRRLACYATSMLTLVVALCFAVSAAGQTITTVAGGYVGDGGPATQATLDYPRDVLLDSAGNLYIADTNNHRVRKVDPSGVITTVAGNGLGGFSGDGGPATDARVGGPRGLALDGDGNLLISNAGGPRIRKVDLTTGIITTVAGNGTCEFSGDGGMATSAGLCVPSGVAVDNAGNVFIVDTWNSRVRKVGTNGRIETCAGNEWVFGFNGDGIPATSAGLSNPVAVAVDIRGNVYVVDELQARVRKIAPGKTRNRQ